MKKELGLKKFKFFFLIFNFLFLLKGESIKITAVGDIMVGTVYPYLSVPEGDGFYLFQEAESIIKKGYIRIGNLESALSDSGSLRKNVVEGKSYAFRTPEKYVKSLKNAGFNILNIANNHIRDFGDIAVYRTKKVLLENSIQYTGFTNDYGVFNIDGKNVCVVGFSNYTLMNDLTDLKRSYDLIDSISKVYDVVIVTFHGGKEGKDAMHVKDQDEYMFGEYRGNIYRFAHTVIDAGADLVIGHGPHVVRGLELYKGKLIAYSLGNFMTFSGINISGVNGLAPILYVEIDPSGNFLSGRIYPFKQVRYKGVFFDKDYEVVKLIKSLTENDFKNKMLKIEDDGSISIR
ncbi:MAG: Bacterial capsule synthesis protein [candidate division TA06 bacterium 32_111]|uniref:Bacterial capsule synthesis protein n=1 Tax=candidate division TA06 bacterium 34_109 TaxID=1635277 RepID=A0A101I1V5_UNCT6|nr:MAG: Bacterial capsule synthesis protein [candidate division TA06 bacterium 32_111]KUK87198.1 MAG: Bacterial capsule synthesis protein [candidate division TA06 bacterium 34_109]HCP17039.1 metallophosphatase [candidate division WOR-3 bacterium]